MTALHPMVQQLPWWLVLSLGIAAAGTAIVLGAALCRATVVLTRLSIETGCAMVARLTDGIIKACVAIAQACAHGLGLVFWLMTRPLAHAFDWLRDAVITGTLNLRGRIARERELRCVWQNEFRHLYPTWREFMRAFDSAESESRRDNPFAAPREEYEEACILLGLPTDAAFTQTQLNTRYRILMAKAHPDAGGSNSLASELNRARDVVRKHKGWRS